MKKEYNIVTATEQDREEILALYKAQIGREFCPWDEHYPSNETIDADFARDGLLVLKEDGILVWKTQGTITGSKFLVSPYYSRMIAESVGFDTLDEFILLAKNRLVSGKIKQQQHARSFHSYFLVFKKSLKKKVAYFDFMTDEQIEETLKGLKKYNINKKRRKEL